MYSSKRVSLATSQWSRREHFLSWRQELILKVAAQADYVPFRYRCPEPPGEMIYGVFRSLIMRGYLRPHRHGFEITELGREKVERMR